MSCSKLCLFKVLFVHCLFVVLLFALSVEAKRHHRRQVHKVRQHQEECEEPEDLKHRLSEWQAAKDSSTAMNDNRVEEGEENKEAEDPDHLPAQEPHGSGSNIQDIPDICKRSPENGVDSSVMERSLCPWQWRLNHDDEREPKLVSEAICLCRKSRGSSGSYCMPIKRELTVLKRVACNPITKKYEYVKLVQSITVGCHSVLPRTQRAKPLSAFYERTNSIEV